MANKNFHKRLGQSIQEYAVLIAIIVTALIAMQVYVKRGIQGRIRDLADQITPPEQHYEQGRTTSDYVTVQKGTTEVRYDRGVSTTTVPEEQITKTGNETTIPEIR